MKKKCSFKKKNIKNILNGETSTSLVFNRIFKDTVLIFHENKLKVLFQLHFDKRLKLINRPGDVSAHLFSITITRLARLCRLVALCCTDLLSRTTLFSSKAVWFVWDLDDLSTTIFSTMFPKIINAFVHPRKLVVYINAHRSLRYNACDQAHRHEYIHKRTKTLIRLEKPWTSGRFFICHFQFPIWNLYHSLEIFRELSSISSLNSWFNT